MVIAGQFWPGRVLAAETAFGAPPQMQKEYSKEQMRAAGESGGWSLSQHSLFLK